MKALALAVSIAALAGAAHAQSSFGCAGGAYGGPPVGSSTLTIAPQDVGRPGFVALVAEKGDDAAYLSQNGQWVYDRMPYHHEYRIFNALPSSFTFDYCIPELSYGEYGGQTLMCNNLTTAFAQGATIYATYGALTPEIEQKANEREARVADTNARLIALGKSPRSFDRQRYIESMVLKDAREKNVRAVGTVPFVDCTPPEFGN